MIRLCGIENVIVRGFLPNRARERGGLRLFFFYDATLIGGRGDREVS